MSLPVGVLFGLQVLGTSVCMVVVLRPFVNKSPCTKPPVRDPRP